MNNSYSPSFPTTGIETGLTKREYFAGLALQGLLSDESGGQGGTYTTEVCVSRAIELADELLKQLESK